MRAILAFMAHRILNSVYGRGASRGALILSGALLALSSGGCASVVGEQDADAKFLVLPTKDGTFFGWSEITIEEDASSVSGATLRAVTVEVLEPSSVPDMGFVKGVLGEVVTSKERVRGVEKSPMPAGERVVPLDIVYTGDLRSFFEDGHTIRIEWTGSTNPSFTAWPKDGIWIRAHIIVAVE